MIRAYRISLYTFFAQTETYEVPEDCHRRNEENGGSIDKIYIVGQLVIHNYVCSVLIGSCIRCCTSVK